MMVVLLSKTCAKGINLVLFSFKMFKQVSEGRQRENNALPSPCLQLLLCGSVPISKAEGMEEQ